MPGPKLLRLLTPPPGVQITLQRPPDGSSSAAAQPEMAPKPSPQKKRRLLMSIPSRPSSEQRSPSKQARPSEVVQGSAAAYPDSRAGCSFGSEGFLEPGCDEMGGSEFGVEGMLLSPDQNGATDAYDLFAEAVMAEAIPFFQLAPELYVVTGWDSKSAKRTVSERTCILITVLTDPALALLVPCSDGLK